MRMQLKYDEPLPNFAFSFNLRRYTTDGGAPALVGRCKLKPVLKAPGFSA